MARGVCSDPVKEAERLEKLKVRAKERSQDPEWRRKNKEATKKTAQKRLQNPEWREKNKEMCQRRSQNPEWIRKRKEAAQRLAKDPEYIKKLSDAATKREKDPAMYKIRSQNPEWIKNHDEASRKMAGDPEWKQNHRWAMQKRAEDENWLLKNIESHLGGFWYGNVRYYEGPLYCEKFDEDFRERVRAFFGYVCPECGSPQNGTRLAVHHINYNKKSCCDPKAPRLFIPLCITNGCHNKTNHNRAYWESHFTEMIMGYYQGKCYFTIEEMAAFSGNL